jgi:hypothetical protein
MLTDRQGDLAGEMARRRASCVEDRTERSFRTVPLRELGPPSVGQPQDGRSVTVLGSTLDAAWLRRLATFAVPSLSMSILASAETCADRLTHRRGGSCVAPRLAEPVSIEHPEDQADGQ